MKYFSRGNLDTVHRDLHNKLMTPTAANATGDAFVAVIKYVAEQRVKVIKMAKQDGLTRRQRDHLLDSAAILASHHPTMAAVQSAITKASQIWDAELGNNLDMN